ncbi:response regulator transcription factor [Paenibacillus crassostreae]|uniref:AraC family transcriptional regulator n=1 Tax=Paenibacillus crassostreae TaxID=1763538 RepID=A0A167GC36_9BACL|nr:helix-turn-helix domain-containing protein [Paenibacillus crassostreae]AOZ92661.1 DNA-binding response regulator [Paenibacillus crassostreae]OAB77430.1 AraC family transcriptional regulator [Paenibacillus crassostreae]
MYRLLIVDDEEIITEALYEVFNQFMPGELDICKAFSAKEALNWLSRTRIDIVLTDIRMPGMSGLELMEEIRIYWPRCRIIFLTGYSEFEYAYQAIQKLNVRYLLKTEGYTKVTQTVQEVIYEINNENQMNNLLEQSQEQMDTLEFMAQSEYFRHFLQDSQTIYKHQGSVIQEFERLNIALDPKVPVVLALGHLSYSFEAAYIEKSELFSLTRVIWNSFMTEQINSVALVDKYGDLLWFLQPSQLKDEKFTNHLIKYMEGTLELIQRACLETQGITISFTISGRSCTWNEITNQYERLRQLQRMKIGDGVSLIQTDRVEQTITSNSNEGFRLGPKMEVLSAHLDAGRSEEFFKCFDEVVQYTLNMSESVHRSVESYYSLALVLLSYINRFGLHHHIGEYSKLMLLDKHISMTEGFQYLQLLAEHMFKQKFMNEQNRASLIIGKIRKFVKDHLSEDLSLVRLAEVHYFNPSYLSRFFKQEHGVNLSEYIDECRIKKAKELLCNGDLKVRDVALLVGYEAAHSFTRFFKRATGMTPQEYRDSIIVERYSG